MNEWMNEKRETKTVGKNYYFKNSIDNSRCSLFRVILKNALIILLHTFVSTRGKVTDFHTLWYPINSNDECDLNLSYLLN